MTKGDVMAGPERDAAGPDWKGYPDDEYTEAAPEHYWAPDNEHPEQKPSIAALEAEVARLEKIVQAELERARERHRAEVERLREALLDCARQAGEDVSGGIPTWPDLVEWASRAVAEMREQHEQDYEKLREAAVEAVRLLNDDYTPEEREAVEAVIRAA